MAPRLRDRYDVAVLLRPEDPWAGAIASAAGIPVRVGYAQSGTRPFLTHALRPESRRRHAVLLAADVLARACSLLGVTYRGVGSSQPPLHPTVDDRLEAEAVMRDVAERTGERPIVIHPGSGWRLKNWPAHRWGDLARYIARRHGVRPLVVGSLGEARVCADAVAASDGNAVQLPRPLSLGGLTALLHRARLVVSVDNGAAHLAALVGTPVVALFGPGDPRTAHPWCPSRRRRVVRVSLPCSPCGRMHDPPCGATQDPECVTDVSVAMMASALEELLAVATGSSRPSQE